MIGAALAIGLRFGGALLEFATSRIGLPICVAVVTYLYAHHAGVVEERNRNALAVQSALLKQQDADAASRQQIAKDNAIRFNASQARVRMLQTQVEKYAAELKTRPPAALCYPTDRDIEWLSRFSPSYRGGKGHP